MFEFDDSAPPGPFSMFEPPPDFLNDYPTNAPRWIVRYARRLVAYEWANMVGARFNIHNPPKWEAMHTVGDWCRYWMQGGKDTGPKLAARWPEELAGVG